MWLGWRGRQTGTWAGEAWLGIHCGGDRERRRWNGERDTVSWLLVPALLTAHVPLCKDFVSSVGSTPGLPAHSYLCPPTSPPNPTESAPNPTCLLWDFRRSSLFFRDLSRPGPAPGSWVRGLSWQHTGGLGWDWGWPLVPLLHYSPGQIGELRRTQVGQC